MYHPSPSKATPEEHLPAPVRCDVLMMHAGAMSSVIGTAAYVATWYFQDYVIASRPSFVHGDSGLSISASPVVAWFIGFVGLAVLCLWLWMARMCAQGRSWARIMATILVALQAYTLYSAPYRHLNVPRASWTGLVPVVSLLIGLTTVILLWQRSSAPYFKGEHRLPPRPTTR